MVTALALALALASAPSPASPITTDMLVETANISGLALSPDGKRIAYRVVRGSIENDKMLVDWFVAGTDGRSPPTRVASGGEALFNYSGSVAAEMPQWSPDSQTLFFRARLKGSVQIWSVRIGSEPSQLTNDPADIVDFALAVDGRSLSYRVGATRDAVRAETKRIYDNGMLVDGTTDLALPVAGGIVVDGERVMSRYTGTWFERVPLLNDTPRTTKTVQLDAPALPPINGGSHLAQGKIRVVPGNGTAKVIVDYPDGRSIECPSLACGVAPVNATWVPGRNALLVSNENSRVTLATERLGRTKLRLWQIGAPTATVLTDVPGTLAGSAYSSVPCAPLRNKAFCVAASAASPPRLVTVDLKKGRQTIVDDPNETLRKAISSPVRQLDWKIGEHNFHGELLLPSSGKGPFPIVLYYYTSRGFLAGAFGEALPVQPLLQNGIAVLVMDKSLLADPVYNAERNYDLAIAGISTIVDTLVREGTIDRARIGAWGFSFGSEVANRLVRTTNLLRVASLSSIQVSEAFYWANAFPGKDMQQRQKDQFGTDWPDRSPETWAKLAPSRTTAALSVPVLLQMPEDEARWMGEYVTSALRDRKPVELHAFADETHIPMNPRHKRAALERNLDWFRYWLTGQRDPSPLKAAQYERWDKLSAMEAAAKRVDGAHP